MNQALFVFLFLLCTGCASFSHIENYNGRRIIELQIDSAIAKKAPSGLAEWAKKDCSQLLIYISFKNLTSEELIISDDAYYQINRPICFSFPVCTRGEPVMILKSGDVQKRSALYDIYPGDTSTSNLTCTYKFYVYKKRFIGGLHIIAEDTVNAVFR